MSSGTQISSGAGHGLAWLASLKARLRAWWEGYDYAQEGVPIFVKAAEAPEAAASEVPIDDPMFEAEPTTTHWNAARIATVQRLFGEGFTGPCNAAMIQTYSKPFGLTEKNSLAIFGSGLGGAARQIAKDTSAWVDGFEPDAALATAGAEMSERAGMAKKAPIVRADIMQAEVRPHSRDAVICIEQLSRSEEKGAMIAKVAEMLKNGGQALFIEMVTGDMPLDSREGAAWQHSENSPVVLSDVTDVTEKLRENGLSVRVAQDISGEYRANALAAFAAYESAIKGQLFDEKLREWVLSEGAYWSTRLAGLEMGIFRIYRFFCRRQD